MRLIGNIVSLVPLALDQIPDLLEYSSDPSLWTWWIRNPPVDEAAMRVEVELALARQAEGVRVPFAIYHNERREHVGSTSLWYIDPVKHSLEIGSTWLGVPFHGMGVNRECKDLLLAHAFDGLEMETVILQTDELNARSRRAIEKLGAVFQEVRKNDMVAWNGRVRSSVYYALTRESWDNARSFQLSL